MKEFIKENIEVYLEAPLLIAAVVLMGAGIPLLQEGTTLGVGLVVGGVLVIMIEKLIEKWDSLRK